MSELRVLWLEDALDGLPQGVSREDVEKILCDFKEAGKYEADGMPRQYMVGDVIVSLIARGNFPLVTSVQVETKVQPKAKPKKKAPTAAPRTPKDLMAELTRQGYTITKSRGTGHFKVWSLDGKKVILTFSQNSSDHRALSNAWAQFRRYQRTQEAGKK